MRAAFFCFSSVLAWPGILLPTGNRPPESLCSFILLCLGWLTFHPCLCCGHLPRDSFPALWPVPEQEHSQAPPTLPGSGEEAGILRASLPGTSRVPGIPAPLFTSLPAVHQSPIIIHSVDLLPCTSIHLCCQYLRPTYCALSIAVLATWSPCCHP